MQPHQGNLFSVGEILFSEGTTEGDPQLLEHMH